VQLIHLEIDFFIDHNLELLGEGGKFDCQNKCFSSKNKGRILLLFPKNGPTFGKFFFWSEISKIMIAQKFRWWAQMAEDNLFHISIIGTSIWDYEDNYSLYRKKNTLTSSGRIAPIVFY